uniref:Uncharacterized protein n=1 Tax=Arundo donax TaxID=35708 RepID=A0A0A9ERL3_ARUDO
MRCSSLLCCHC